MLTNVKVASSITRRNICYTHKVRVVVNDICMKYYKPLFSASAENNCKFLRYYGEKKYQTPVQDVYLYEGLPLQWISSDIKSNK